LNLPTRLASQEENGGGGSQQRDNADTNSAASWLSLLGSWSTPAAIKADGVATHGALTRAFTFPLAIAMLLASFETGSTAHPIGGNHGRHR
jgi:hypothetical protein